MDHFTSLGPDDSLDILEAWTLLAGMAAHTSHTRIDCSVTGNTYRHPAVLAKAAVTVDHLSGGRLEFGISAGWAENEHSMLGLPFGTAGDRADRLEEALPIIRSLWTEPCTTFTGKHYQLRDAVAEPNPTQSPHPPIWIGGVGRKRTLRIAAEHAAVWNSPAEPHNRSASAPPCSTSTVPTSAATQRRSADPYRSASRTRSTTCTNRYAASSPSASPSSSSSSPRIPSRRPSESPTSFPAALRVVVTQLITQQR
jgi:alkanesulfonate monooxygenase SsuD/methylene tetrahydromethanopterin reductase-like flavin-dependent oxidoreductase (luciferase family)